MAKFTCPFCMREYDKKDIQYVCNNGGGHQKNNELQPDGRYWFSAGRFSRGTVKCKCGEMVTTRGCPKCNQILPKMALETPNLPFSIVGVSNSGKTNYITVMLHELGRSSGLNLALGHETTDTLDHQRKNERTIYEEHETVEATRTMEMPQIWYIKNLQEQHGNAVPTYTFTIYDGAGERYENNLEAGSVEFNYIKASKAILLTIDPLLLPNISRGGIVDANVMNNSLGQNRTDYVRRRAEDVLNGVAEYIKSARGIAVTKKLDVPVAVVLTKFDTILSHPVFGPQALIKNPSLTVKNGRVDLAEIQEVDREIRYWLEQIGESGFINVLESHFKEYCFFGVSSFGASPTSQGVLPDEIRPHRVLDPILWLFKRFKFIS